MAREAAAIDVDFRTRGARANEAIDVLRLQWAGGAEGVAYSGQFVSFDDMCVFAKPVQGAKLPIHVGRVKAYADQGVNRLVVNPPQLPVDQQLAQLTDFARRVSLG